MPVPVSETVITMNNARASRFIRIVLINEKVFGTNTQSTAIWHSIASVNAEVHQHLMQLSCICTDSPKVWRYVCIDFWWIWEISLRNLLNFFKQVPDLKNRALSPFIPRANPSTCLTKLAPRLVDFQFCKQLLTSIRNVFCNSSATIRIGPSTLFRSAMPLARCRCFQSRARRNCASSCFSLWCPCVDGENWFWFPLHCASKSSGLRWWFPGRI